ncbi:MAG: tetratricopeptide repeat protein [Spirochaetales bacterium]|nr:tetratricopeptide repeat protein [Spirochaetales bacterium]
MRNLHFSVLIFVFSFLVVFTSGAETVDGLMTLDYLEGEMQIKRSGNWVNAQIGDKLSLETLVKLAGNSVAEISGNSSSLTITRAGIYSLKDLLNKKKRVFTSGLVLVFKNLYKLFRSTSRQASGTAMGVRGAEIEDLSNGMEWVSEDDEYLNEAKDLIKKGDFAKAVLSLKEGLDLSEDPDTTEEYLYYLGYTYAMLGKNAQALSYFKKVKEDDSKAYYDNFILINGRLLIDSLNFRGALSLFTPYLEKYPHSRNSQLLYFLSGICYRELNKKEAAVENLKKALKINPVSDIGTEADKELKALK